MKKLKQITSLLLTVIIAVALIAAVTPLSIQAENTTVQEGNDSDLNILTKDGYDLEYVDLNDVYYEDGTSLADRTLEEEFGAEYQQSTDFQLSCDGTKWGQYNTDYYYNQLSARQRLVYDQLDSASIQAAVNSQTLKTVHLSNGDYEGIVADIEFEDMGLTSDQVFQVYMAFVFSNPQYYFIANSYSLTETRIVMFCYDIFVDGSNRAVATTDFFSQADEWISEANHETTDLDKEKKIHDIICENVTYEEVENGLDQTAYSAVVYKKSVCTGYAKTFALLCNAVSLETIVLTGGNHAWNQIYINGNWYIVDCTWDDRDLANNPNSTVYSYFNVSEDFVNSVSEYVKSCHTPMSVYDGLRPSTGEGQKEVEPITEIYRLYSPINAEHLYTPDWNEVSVLTKQAGWTYEGVAWETKSSGTAVYRLYNDTLQNHLYTTDTNEIRVLIGQHDGWVMDNNGDPLFYSGGDTNVYRLYNRALRGLHLLTTDYNEYSVLPGDGYWQQEGIALSGV